jgi:hypothetical protein
MFQTEEISIHGENVLLFSRLDYNVPTSSPKSLS